MQQIPTVSGEREQVLNQQMREKISDSIQKRFAEETKYARDQIITVLALAIILQIWMGI